MSEDVVEVIDHSEREDEDVSLPFRYHISSYGADYPVDILVGRMKRKDIYIPEFQRGFVWNWIQASRFIESLLLGFPVPGIFLFKQSRSKRLIVVDGQQRLMTLKFFYGGMIGSRPFKLKGVDPELEGKTYESLDVDLQRVLNDSILHATVFQQDEPKGSPTSARVKTPDFR